jgi:hypothetical protein
VPTPLAVKVVDCPEQTDKLPVMIAFGNAGTVIMLGNVFVQPVASVIVSVTVCGPPTANWCVTTSKMLVALEPVTMFEVEVGSSKFHV